MLECKGIATPMDGNQSRSEGSRLDAEQDQVERLPYQQLVGSLMYTMAGAKPDLAYALGTLAQHMQEPRVSHCKAAQRVLRYIQATKELQLTFQAGAELE